MQADKLRLEELFNNLISNAIKFTENGSIIIELAKIDSNFFKISVSDNYISNIVYAANGSDVDSTIINGLPIMLNKELINIDKEKILEEAEICAKNLTSGI